MPKHLLSYFLIPWALLLISAPYIAGYIFNVNADTGWYIDAISTELLVVVLTICLLHKDKAFYALLVVVVLDAIYLTIDILTTDMQSILHLVGYNG